MTCNNKQYGPRFDGSINEPISITFNRDYSEVFQFNGVDWTADDFSASVSLVPNGVSIFTFTIGARLLVDGATRFTMLASDTTLGGANILNLFDASGETVELYWDMERIIGGGTGSKRTVLYGPCYLNGSV